MKPDDVKTTLVSMILPCTYQNHIVWHGEHYKFSYNWQQQFRIQMRSFSPPWKYQGQLLFYIRKGLEKCITLNAYIRKEIERKKYTEKTQRRYKDRNNKDMSII